MKYPLLLISLILLCSGRLLAEKEKYAFKTIPPAMLQHANAVIRESTTEINIVSKTEIREIRRFAVTVLNEEGSKYGMVMEYYSKQSSVESIYGKLYDATGAELAKIKNGSVRDIGITSESFFDDYRAKVFEFHYATYPYTCVYEIVTISNSSLFLPWWRPQTDHDCAVEKATCTISYPQNMSFRYRTFHIPGAPVAHAEKKQNTLRLNIDNLAASPEPDELAPATDFAEPTLIMATDYMSLLGVDGSMATWKDLGAFVYKLNANRDTLPAATQKLVHQLTDTCATAKSKITVLYNYLKTNTRYVNISLGIGGWQTLDAQFVASTGFGDCKALSNYMKALLKEAGINAYQALVKSGQKETRKMQPDFPFSIFDHVILCVPVNADTTWLECTAKDLEAGYLSSFTSNRNVLLLTPQGGYAVRTPAYNEQANTMARCAQLSINENDEVHGAVTASYMGYWWDSEHEILNEGKSQKDNYCNQKLAIPNYTAGDYKMNTGSVNGIPALYEYIPFTGSNMLSKSGDRVFVSPRVFNLSVASASTASVNDSFQLFQDMQASDTTVITLSGNYEAEKLATDINLDFSFAAYHTKTVFENGNVLKIIVYYRQKQGVYPPALFADYKKISRLVNTNAAYSKAVLHKKM